MTAFVPNISVKTPNNRPVTKGELEKANSILTLVTSELDQEKEAHQTTKNQLDVEITSLASTKIELDEHIAQFTIY